MSLILNIDSSLETAAVCLAENGVELYTISNRHQKDHAAFLHNAIKDIMQEKSLKLGSIAGIAVTNGPGSYTGLRVGMASAKGLCYALNKPFITLGTLDIMANAVITVSRTHNDVQSLYCPLIDARRMEVFTALFDGEMNCISAPAALILDQNSFKEILKTNRVCFFGNGAGKLKAILSNENAGFLAVPELMGSMSKLSFDKFLARNFTDLIDSEPLYIKDFHSSPDKSNKK